MQKNTGGDHVNRSMKVGSTQKNHMCFCNTITDHLNPKEALLHTPSPHEIESVISLLQAYLTSHYPTRKITTGEYTPSGEPRVRVEIFSTGLSPGEALTKYLKEVHGLSYHSIGQAISRDERGIWGTYKRATQKMKQPFTFTTPPRYLIPVSHFADRSLSILQVAVKELHSVAGMRFSEIARLLDKSYSTIYSTYSRPSRTRRNRRYTHDNIKRDGK